MTKKNFYEDVTILIVDDNPTNLKVLSQAIASSGWEILIATDGQGAIEQAEYAHPDLILLDVIMPDIDGFQTCAELKQNPVTKNIPVIFLSALNDKFDKVQGLLIGGVDYITKPFQVEEVLARIQVHLKLNFLTKQLEAQNQQLDRRVEERTQELTQALNELKKSQLQLIQKEKLSTLGQLVAGVAHEINNPLGFVTGNFEFINNYLNALLNHLSLYQQCYPNPDIAITKNAKLIELAQIVEDIPQIISSINLGLDRIIKISDSLRNVSRTDTSQKIEFDIHECIESTLIILSHRFKRNKLREDIEVIKDYGRLPLIEGYPEQINQVLMNIIANAIDAFDESAQTVDNQTKTKNKQQIVIKTLYEPEQGLAIIGIKDNGLGIPPEIQTRIFEQFFTTKPLGKGTGLGLSISQHIIEEKHHGKLKLFSTLGESTEFLIEIPVDN
ncbi:response regulator [Nostoc sp. FACHB-110]|uniref:hybrid sensor histidine kinase/response regulator n=1 Tax=Nostoc sp. FACHB-110 TaxID=2692834 RepID=UPI00168A1268|nr:response regulator [Nostoc sp. FACHB-110]MBD2436312.1 response regulator [Nostoc sp. FACHB-110]